MLANCLSLREDLFGFICETVEILREIYGTETEPVIQALKTPGETLAVRVNLLRIAREKVLQIFEDEGNNPLPHPSLEEVVLLPITDSGVLPEEEGMEVLVDKNTAEAVMRGADVFAPGIIRCHKVKTGEKVCILGPNGERVGYGTALMSQNEVLSLRRGLAIRIERTRYRIPSLRQHRLYLEGLIYPQTLPSILASRNLKPQREETIVDMNAAPGGKVAHLAQLTGDSGRIFAFDRHETKIQELKANLHREGIRSVQTRVADSRYLHMDFPMLRADSVLVDPPCSALGLRPKLYDLTTKRKVKTVSDYQRQFLETAAKILKPQGKILYSVCTMTLEECESQVRAVCDNYGLTVTKQEFMLGSSGISNDPELTNCQRFHPHIHDTPGFFIALLVKTGG